ncbi:MAG: hypothetical protein WCL71_12885 [Deltaproteobacteria bacterium]
MKGKNKNPSPMLGTPDAVNVIDAMLSLDIGGIIIETLGLWNLTAPNPAMRKILPWRNEALYEVTVFFLSGRIESATITGKFLSPPSIPEILKKLEDFEGWTILQEANVKTGHYRKLKS